MVVEETLVWLLYWLLQLDTFKVTYALTLKDVSYVQFSFDIIQTSIHANRQVILKCDFKIRLTDMIQAENVENMLQMHALPSVLSKKQVASSVSEQMIDSGDGQPNVRWWETEPIGEWRCG